MNDPKPGPALTGNFSSLRSPEFPYPGLRAFEDYETEIFFGREHHIQEIIKRLSQHQFVPVIGPSGCGKSSLVRAGVIPMLRAGGYRHAGAEWRDVVMRPSNAPIWNLAQSLYDIVHTSSQAESSTKNKIAENRLEGISELASALTTDPKNGISRLRADADLDENVNVLLVVDQFEEIFSQENAQTPGAVADFLNLILGIHENDFNRVHCIITMRTDHLGDCARYRGLSEAINETFYLTANLTEEELREAIELPAGVEPFYGEFVDGLPERILADMSAEDEDQLPLMQHVLRRMWEAAALRSSEQPKLTADLYHEFGGIKNAINVHAKAIQQKLIRDHGEGHEAIIERLFKQLTVRREGATYQDVRRPTTFRDLAAVLDITKKADKNHLRAVINEFRAPDALFLRPQYSELPANQRISDAVSIDIVHECLIRKWPSLTNWIDEEWQSAKLLHDLNRLQANSRTASGEAYLNDPQITRFDRWRVAQRPNAAWAAQYGCSRNNLTKMIDYLDLSKERAERARREEIAQREEEAKRQEQIARLEAENQRNEAEKKLLDAERDRKLEVERANVLAVTEREKRKTVMLVSVVLLCIATTLFGYYQYRAFTETKALREFWENFSYNSQRKEDIANIAIDSQARSRDHFLELITTAETVGSDVRDVAARVVNWAKALDEIKFNKSVVESKFLDKFDEIIEKHKEMENPLEQSAKEKLQKKIDTTVSAIDKNIAHIEDDLKLRISQLPEPVRAFRGDISRVALSSKGELIALGIGTGTIPETTQANNISAVRPRIILKTLSGKQQMVQPELYYPREIGYQPTVLDMKFSSDDRYFAAIVFHSGQSNTTHNWTLYAWQTADGKQIASLSIPILQMSEGYLQRLDLHRKYFQLAFDTSEASVAIVTASGFLVTCRLYDCRSTKVERQLNLASARPQSGSLDEKNTDALGNNEVSLKYPHRLIALGTNEFGAIFAPETGIGLQLHKFKSSADVPETIKLMHTIELNEFSEQSEIELSTCVNSSAFFAFNAAKKQVHAWVLDKDAGNPTICGRRFARAEQNGDILHVYQTPNMPGAWRKADDGNENPQFSTYRTNLNSPDHYLGAYVLPFTISQHSNDASGNFVATLTATFSSGKLVKRVAVWRTQPGLHGAQNFASAACDRLYVLRPHFESSYQGRAKSPTPADCKPYLTHPIEEEALQ